MLYKMYSFEKIHIFLLKHIIRIYNEYKYNKIISVYFSEVTILLLEYFTK